MVAPARCTVIGEVMDHLSKPQWLGCMTLICPDQFLQSTTGSFLQLLPVLFSVLSDSVSWSTPLISPLYSKVYHLPSCLSKLVKVLRGIPKTQILLIFTPIASLHRTLCNLLCTFLPPRSGSAHYQARSFKRMSSKSLVVGKKASTEKTEVSLTRS